MAPSLQHFRDRLSLKDPEILQNKGYINDEWVDAKSGKRFEVEGAYTLLAMKYQG